MLKIIIADDEPHFRMFMEHVLDWKTMGIRLCGICKDGEEVLKEAKEKKPDIALLDINMPGMSGITLGEQLKTLLPDIHIVFITGYSEFEYARRALQIGAEEYLVKPFSKEELHEVIQKLKLKIEKDKTLRRQQNNDLKVIREETMKKWVMGNVPKDMEKFRQSLIRMGIPVEGKGFFVCVLEIDHIARMQRQGEDVELWKFGMKNVASEVLNVEDMKSVVFSGLENRVIILLNLKKCEGSARAKMAYFEKIRRLIKSYFGFTISGGVGSLVGGVEEVPRSYQEALTALEGKFLEGTNRILYYEDEASSGNSADFYRLELNDRLLNSLRRQDREGISRIFHEMQEEIQKKRISSDYAYMMLNGMMSICLSYITEMGGSISSILGEDFSPYSQLYEKNSLEECLDLLEQVFLKAMDAFREGASKRGLEIVRQVEAYIEEHYMDIELTVEQVAAGVFLDGSYIRKQVGRYLNCTVSELITNVRMKKAKSLIESEGLSVSEVSERVGYSESGYFSKCFKKQYGISPKAYDKMCREKE